MARKKDPRPDVLEQRVEVGMPAEYVPVVEIDPQPLQAGAVEQLQRRAYAALFGGPPANPWADQLDAEYVWRLCAEWKQLRAAVETYRRASADAVATLTRPVT